MDIKFLLIGFIIWIVAFPALSQTADIVVLNRMETDRLKRLIRENEQPELHYDSIARLANRHLRDSPRPPVKMFYEGLLPTNPDRIETERSLEDIDKSANLIYAWYGNSKNTFVRKAKEIVLAWASTYQPTGNTINENKLVPLFWVFFLFQDQFSNREKLIVEDWMIRIAKGQMVRPVTPNNNWEAKRLKIIGTAGCVLDDKTMIDFSVKGFKEYINTAYYDDGTSNDLRERDALHYHASGLKPTIAVFVNCTPFQPAFDLFDYYSPSGASIRKSVEYVLPYVTGEIQRKEWVNSKVKLDRERAAAGLAEYQPGMLFDPKEAIPMFEWASYYNPEWYALFGQGTEGSDYSSTWVGLLNSPLIRK